MNYVHFNKLSFVAIAAFSLSGCGNGIAPQSTGASSLLNSPAKSWISPEAKSGDLIYVSDSFSTVDIYTYPQLQKSGQLTGFQQAEGLCTDKAGNVWVANFGAQELDKYAHGSTKKLATLKLPNDQSPVDCAVNIQTGDLAVTSWRGGSGPGYVTIYKAAKGTPHNYTDSKFVYAYSLGYDLKQNLFVDGLAAGSAFQYAELPKGKTAFTPIKLQKSIAYPGSVQYDGKYIAVGDQTAAKIYRTSGAKIIATVSPTGSGNLTAFDIVSGKSLVAYIGSNLSIYPYPGGGSPSNSISISSVAGLTVSLK